MSTSDVEPNDDATEETAQLRACASRAEAQQHPFVSLGVPVAGAPPSMEDMQKAYQLNMPLATAAKKKRKLRQPRDCRQNVAAAKRKVKVHDVAAAKALGEHPGAEPLQSLGERRTGLCNLGATCYMNSLLQTLFMNHAFRRGIFQWCEDPDWAPDSGAKGCGAMGCCM